MIVPRILGPAGAQLAVARAVAISPAGSGLVKVCAPWTAALGEGTGVGGDDDGGAVVCACGVG